MSAKEYANRNRQGSSWFSHDDKVKDIPAAKPPQEVTSSPPTSNNDDGPDTPRSSIRTQMIKPVCNSNQWYKYDKDDNKTDPAEVKPVQDEVVSTSPPSNNDQEADQSSGTRTQMIKPVCNSNQWYKYDQKNGSDESAAGVVGSGACHVASTGSSGNVVAAGSVSGQGASGGQRGAGREGDTYSRRDKQGSSSDWFQHEHSESAGGSCVSPRCASKEGGQNANRMRGESENWFDHAANKDIQEAPHSARGGTRRPQSSDMHNIFHME